MIYEVDFVRYKNFKNIEANVDKLVDMGVTIFQLMPIMEHDNIGGWGYCGIFLDQIHHEYGTIEELKSLIRKVEGRGGKVFVDTVFNHCKDVGQFPKSWFIPNFNGSGCGNTFNAHNRDFQDYCMNILHKLKDIGVKGFRFDLAPLLRCNKDGKQIYEGSLMQRIDNELSCCTIIVEPWSCVSYDKASFKMTNYEWSDQTRDTLRKFMLCRCKLYEVVGCMNSYVRNINFITCHDGMSLLDVLSYPYKNNYINGEENRDGNSNEVVGEYGFDLTEKIDRVKKGIKLLILAKGIPMIRSYDELLITYFGNNNNWRGLAEYDLTYDLSEYIKECVELRNTIDHFYPYECIDDNTIGCVGKDGVYKKINI